MPKLRIPSPRLLFCCIPQAARPHLPSFTTKEKALSQRQRRRHHGLPDGGPCLSQARSWNNIPSCATLEQAGRTDTLAGFTAGGWGSQDYQLYGNWPQVIPARQTPWRRKWLCSAGECLAGYSQRLGHGWTCTCASTQAPTNPVAHACKHSGTRLHT